MFLYDPLINVEFSHTMKQMQTALSSVSDPKPLKDCLTGSVLGKLVHRAQQILALQKAIQYSLPPEFVAQYRVLNIEKGVLTIASESASLVTRLRYLSPELMETLNSISGLPMIQQIICRVMPLIKY